MRFFGSDQVTTRQQLVTRSTIGLGLLALLVTVGQVDAKPPATSLERQIQVLVTLPESAADSNLSGRLFLFTSQRPGAEPRRGPNWFSPEPFFGKDIRDWKPGTQQTIDADADYHPVPLAELSPGKYRFQALFDHDFYYPSPGDGVGNFYSEVVDVEIGDEDSIELKLTLDQVVEAPQWPDSKWIEKIEYRSDLLSDFHQREVNERVAVVLPASYFDEPDRRYPTMYVVSGFGGSLQGMVRRYGRRPRPAAEGEAEFIRVLMTGECKWGHHVYADSATNGPRGQAVLDELIPLIDSQFRTVADSRARYVGGHSSGGWSSLWLQVTYPETFGGVWSTSPDPVDFRDYQQTDLYASPTQSIYYDEDGEKRPLARRGETPMIYYPDFAGLDDCLKRGGQLRSFEAVFSPRGVDGEPAQMWDRKSGKVNPEVVEAWKAYDISLKLRTNWEELGPKLAGKLHVTMGDLDTFYLEGATILLKQELEKLGSDAKVVIIPGANHGDYMGDPEFQQRQRTEMSQQYFQHFDAEGKPKKKK